MSSQVTVPVIPPCDICRYEEHREMPNPAQWDLRTVTGSWANVCRTHRVWALYLDAHGEPSLGTGKGQRLVLAQ